MSTNNVVLSEPEKAALSEDATNRSIRTIWQGLGIDVLVAVALLVVNILTDANGWSDLDWKIIGFSLMKTVLMAGAAFVMRRFMDPSKIPTPLPSTPQPAPAVPADDAGTESAPVLPAPEPILEREDTEHEYDGSYPPELDVDGDGETFDGSVAPETSSQMRSFMAVAAETDEDRLNAGIAKDNENFPGGGA